MCALRTKGIDSKEIEAMVYVNVCLSSTNSVVATIKATLIVKKLKQGSCLSKTIFERREFSTAEDQDILIEQSPIFNSNRVVRFALSSKIFWLRIQLHYIATQ